MVKNKILIIITMIVFTLSLCSCGADSGNEVNSENGEFIVADDFDLVYSNPDSYKGDEVEFYGKIFTDVERDENGTYMQIFSNEDGTDNNVLVAIGDPNLNVEYDDIVYVRGMVKGAEKAENAFGAELILPLINASKVEVVDYSTAFSPALKTIEVNEEQNQSGYKLTLIKVEIAKNETRAFLKIENASDDILSFYSFNSVLTQESNQIEQEDNWGANYPEISSEIQPGIIQEGIVTFGAVDLDGEELNIIFEGHSDDYYLDFTPFKFKVSIK